MKSITYDTKFEYDEAGRVIRKIVTETHNDCECECDSDCCCDCDIDIDTLSEAEFEVESMPEHKLAIAALSLATVLGAMRGE